MKCPEKFSKKEIHPGLQSLTAQMQVAVLHSRKHYCVLITDRGWGKAAVFSESDKYIFHIRWFCLKSTAVDVSLGSYIIRTLDQLYLPENLCWFTVVRAMHVFLQCSSCRKWLQWNEAVLGSFQESDTHFLLANKKKKGKKKKDSTGLSAPVGSSPSLAWFFSNNCSVIHIPPPSKIHNTGYSSPTLSPT